MSEEIPHGRLEKSESVEDNARKFIVDRIDSDFIKAHETSSYKLKMDWLSADENSEKRIIYKETNDGEIQYFMATKVSRDGSRSSDKHRISEGEYKGLIGSSIGSVEKKRHELTVVQGSIPFSMRYDEFKDKQFSMLEVDASNPKARESFDPSGFPYKLSEVSDDSRYSGFKITRTLLDV